MGNGAVRGRHSQVVPAAPIDASQLIATSSARQFPLEPTVDGDVGWEAAATSHSSREAPAPTGAREVEAACGQCLIFLEQARGVAGLVSVRAVAAGEDGSLLGRVAEWPGKRCNEVATWFSAQLLDLPFIARRAVVLRLELWDRRRLLGSLTAPLCDVPEHSTVTRGLVLGTCSSAAAKPSTLSFQILSSRAAVSRHTVFFVRHGESVWNQAQKRLQLHRLVSSTDHPLTTTGKEQAEALAKRLASVEAQTDPEAAELLQPDVIFVSPLTRAVQTAVIALGAVAAAAQGPGGMILMANARERQNRGGRDTRSTKVGASIVQASLEALRGLYSGRASEVLNTSERLRYDVEEVQECWWCENAKESEVQLQARLNEFMAQLLYSPHRTIVVVGHSHFFRAVFRKYLSEQLKAVKPNLARDLQRKKIMNCGVVRVELDSEQGLDGGPIVAVDLILDSVMVPAQAGGQSDSERASARESMLDSGDEKSLKSPGR